MAKQTKQYRKFVASSVTAALVATAVAPAAGFAAEKDFTDSIPAWAKDAVDYLVGKDAIAGYPDGTFKQAGKLTRAEAAKILALSLDLTVDKDAKTDFADAKNHWASSYIAAIQKEKPGVINGYNGKFNPNDNITRQEMAKMVVTAYGLELNASADISFSDNTGWGADQVNILASLGVVEGVAAGKFSPNADVTRGQAAVFVHRTEVEDVRVEVPSKVASVTAVSAINSTTLQLKGGALTELKAEDLTVTDNTVVSVTPSADGLTATVKLGTQLVDGEEATLKHGENTFKFTFILEVDTVSVKELTYDDDTKNQYVKLVVNGQEVTALDLIAAGYEVAFNAYEDKKAQTPASIFESNSDTSTNGLLEDDLQSYATTTDGKVAYVTVTVTKGSEVLVSDLNKITIKNTDLATESITGYALLNNDIGYAQTSNILVVGETATIDEITVKAGSDEDDIADSDQLYTVTSSNPAVIAVDKSGGTGSGVLNALTPGTSTITIAYGKTSKSITLTVKNEARDLNRVELVKSNGDRKTTSALATDGVTDVSSTVFLKPVDQYGDVFVTNAVNTLSLAVDTSDNAIATATLGSVNTKGWYPVTLDPVAKGTAYLTVKNNGFVPTYASHKITVSENVTIANYKLELVSNTGYSRDATLNISDDDTVRYELNGYSLDGVLVDTVDLTSATIEVVQNADIIADPVTVDVAGAYMDIVASTKTGTASVIVTYNGKKYTQKITVINEALQLKSVNFKAIASPKYAVTYNYATALTVNASANNPIVSGLTFTSTPSQPARIVPGTGGIYIDKNANGVMDGSEAALAVLSMDFIGADGTLAGETTDVATGIALGNGNDEGTLVYYVKDTNGKVITSKSVVVDL